MCNCAYRMPLIITALAMAGAALAEPSNRNFQRQSGGDDAGIEANDPKAAEEAGMFDLAAPVHDHFKAAIAGDLAAILADNVAAAPF